MLNAVLFECERKFLMILDLKEISKWPWFPGDRGLPAQKASTAELHYDDIIMGAIACQITSLTVVYSTVYSDADQRKHQSSSSLAFVWGIHRGPVNSPHKWPVTRKILPFDDVIMIKARPHYAGLGTVTPITQGYIEATIIHFGRCIKIYIYFMADAGYELPNN